MSPEQRGLIPQLRQRVAAGEPLAALAEEHSKCPSRSNGGSLGWIGRGQTVPEFEEAAFSTSPGGLAVCETRFGVHLVQVTGERCGGAAAAAVLVRCCCAMRGGPSHPRRRASNLVHPKCALAPAPTHLHAALWQGGGRGGAPVTAGAA